MMDEELAIAVTGLAHARNAVLKMMESSANDPRMVFVSKHLTSLYHLLVAADFVLADVVNGWRDFKARSGGSSRES